MRIVGGSLRGKKLVTPEGLSTRPTSMRARESIFNILEHQDFGRKALRGGVILDGFSGSGALGLEALSRGADHAIFMDRDERAVQALRENIRACHLSEKSEILRADIFLPPVCQRAISLVFLDPPYEAGTNEKALQVLHDKDWIKPGTLCVLEQSKKDRWQPETGYDILDIRTYGAAKILFLWAQGQITD